MMLRREGEHILYWKYQILTLDNTIDERSDTVIATPQRTHRHWPLARNNAMSGWLRHSRVYRWSIQDR